MKYIPKEELIVRTSRALSFRGSEFWAEELDALSVHTELAKEKFQKDMETIRRPSSPSLVAVALYGTQVDKDFAQCLARELKAAEPHVVRVAFIGLERGAKILAERALRECGAGFSSAFFSDFEKGKEWLVPGR